MRHNRTNNIVDVFACHNRTNNIADMFVCHNRMNNIAGVFVWHNGMNNIVDDWTKLCYASVELCLAINVKPASLFIGQDGLLRWVWGGWAREYPWDEIALVLTFSVVSALPAYGDRFISKVLLTVHFFRYVTSALELQGHMSRLNHANEDDDNNKPIDCLKISFEHEYPLEMNIYFLLSMCWTLAPTTTRLKKLKPLTCCIK